MRTRSRKNVCAVRRKFLRSLPLGNYLPFIVSSSNAKVAALPWFDLNLNFGASYICRVGPYTPANSIRLSLSLSLGRLSLPFFLFLSFSPSTPTFIQWITSLVATFRGLLIPAGQIIQIGLLRSCPNLMSVMLLYPLHSPFFMLFLSSFALFGIFTSLSPVATSCGVTSFTSRMST